MSGRGRTLLGIAILAMAVCTAGPAAAYICGNYIVDGHACSFNNSSSAGDAGQGPRVTESQYDGFWCSVPRGPDNPHSDFEYVLMNMRLSGTDSNDSVKSCLYVHDSDSTSYVECDCEVYEQVGNDDYYSETLYWALGTNDCSDAAYRYWPTVANTKFWSVSNPTDNYLYLKRAIGYVYESAACEY